MKRVWKHAKIRKRVSWKESTGPGGSVRLQDVGVKWPRCDVIVLPDSRNINLKDTCPDDVKKRRNMWSKDRFSIAWTENLEHTESKYGFFASDKGSANKEKASE